ncbi:Whi5 like [Geosmithia morbida]|uniref:Whi5 like n=1 Tax=Geosmithia morbida TaxID=1094350 RepID=A0A9P4YR21_9HYPO|nr:Whi5 like [Geosmithia morbida]KAF4121536.1 Whi5 like [Geosmithia morbida]
MTSPWKKQPEDVVDSVLKRAELSKIARHLQNRLALAQFKTKHGWEDLTLDTIEPKFEEEMRRKRALEISDVHSDSSSSASDLPYPSGRNTLMSSPLKAPFFSDAVGSSNGSSGHRKRTYLGDLDNAAASSPSKRFRVSPTARKSTSSAAAAAAAAAAGGASFGGSHLGGHAPWKDTHQLTQSSPIKPRRQQHFTTSNGPDVSFFQTNLNLAVPSDDDDDLLPAHSFDIRSSPPRTPPMRTTGRRSRDATANSRTAPSGAGGGGKPEEGADLLIYLANSPSPAVKNGGRRTAMEPPSTPPQKTKNLDLPSSMMMTPGGGNLFPNTPGQTFDFADYVNITPSPAQKPWKTPVPLSAARTPLSAARRRLTFDEPLS